jgi:cation diffusion facilitator CzcD-associated flavoprotein CzcO
MNNALITLEAQVRADLARTAHPNAAWLAPKQAPNGGPALDALVVGAGASAFDNAATALEAGAAAVHLFCRRAEIQVIQPYRWLTFRGFLRQFSDLDDGWRWRFMRAILEMRQGFPQADLRSLCPPSEFSPARRRADRSREEDGPWRRIADAEGRFLG